MFSIETWESKVLLNGKEAGVSSQCLLPLTPAQGSAIVMQSYIDEVLYNPPHNGAITPLNTLLHLPLHPRTHTCKSAVCKCEVERHKGAGDQRELERGGSKRWTFLRNDGLFETIVTLPSVLSAVRIAQN